jgi:hypothetical protein
MPGVEEGLGGAVAGKDLNVVGGLVLVVEVDLERLMGPGPGSRC